MVGCGNIASYFDEQHQNIGLPYTHVGAYCQDGRFNVSACVEPSVERKKTFMGFWQVECGFSNLDECLEAGAVFDVVSLCSPTATHYDDLQKIIKLQPRLIFCEKPITLSVEETKSVLARCQQHSILLAVNYTRAWDPAFEQLKVDRAAGLWGELRSVSGLYNKGILNNGSHLLDLIYSIVGEMELTSVGRAVFDYSPNDPTVPALLESKTGIPIHLMTAHAEDYAVFELQLVFSKGVLVMEEAGFKWRARQVEGSAIFSGYQKLNEGTFEAGSYEKSMLRAVDNIYHAVNQNEMLVKTGQDAFKVQVLCEKIKCTALQEGHS